MYKTFVLRWGGERKLKCLKYVHITMDNIEVIMDKLKAEKISSKVMLPRDGKILSSEVGD